LLEKSGESDFLRAVAEAVLQILMEADVEGLIGAGRHERSADRLNYRNGYRERSFDTRLGSLSLRIPKLRQGSYFPPFLEPRKTAEKALVTVIQEAWIGGVSTRRVDELVQAMGLSGISKSLGLQVVQRHRRAAPVLGDFRIDKLAAQRSEALEGAALIGADQLRIARHIGGDDRGEPAGGRHH
jgi:hypothetical protein